MAPAVDEEAGRAGGAAALGRVDVALDAGTVHTGVDLPGHPLGVEAEVAADREHRLARELRLHREEGIVVLPEAALGGGGLAGLGRFGRQRVALGDRQVAEGEDQPVAKALVHPAQDRLGPEAEGALEVAEHDQLQRPARLAADVVL